MAGLVPLLSLSFFITSCDLNMDQGLIVCIFKNSYRMFCIFIMYLIKIHGEVVEVEGGGL